MEKTVGLKDLRENLETYINAVKKGSSFLVLRRSKPVFRLSPTEESETWESVVDFTRLKKGGLRLPDLLSRL